MKKKKKKKKEKKKKKKKEEEEEEEEDKEEEEVVDAFTEPSIPTFVKAPLSPLHLHATISPYAKKN
ncbi:LOW QUALITY PROTEIN: hypothetical protein ElyMa_003398500 [Elysia marginata]|uniref:Uncharacterized protein n=1 Tax=Elysia marginata TaxID=1093978 RepID=A0AAV4JM02_9GAST|nr:LOW QUALITY PROTEIN: hypothetical protein ElyMa_003398500 [Elysia marginata]